MMIRTSNPAIVATAVILYCSCILPAAWAADAHQGRRVEATLFGGYRFGGSLQDTKTETASNGTVTESLVDVHLQKGTAYGLAINWEAEADSFYELSYSRQNTALETATPIDVSVEYLQIGGYVSLAEPTAYVIPHFLLTVGAARFTPDDAGLETLTKPSVAVGVGAKIPFTSHIALRLDARLKAAFFQGQTDVFCRTNNDPSCKIHLQGGTLVQPEVALGVTVGF